MLNCRGILVVGPTNTARTLMAQAMLQRRFADRCSVQSAGDLHVPGGGAAASRHPLALQVMTELDPAYSALMHANMHAKVLPHNDAKTRFDVLVRIIDLDGSSSPQAIEADVAAVIGGEQGHSELPPGLMPQGAPRHWSVHFGTGLLARRNRLWSTDDQDVADTNNMSNRFSDEYQGEPLFETRKARFTQYRLSEQWALENVRVARPMERERQHLLRFRRCRDDIADRVGRLAELIESRFKTGANDLGDAERGQAQAAGSGDNGNDFDADIREEVERLLPPPPKASQLWS
jgi:protein-tyrosine-phosphatase